MQLVSIRVLNRGLKEVGKDSDQVHLHSPTLSLRYWAIWMQRIIPSLDFNDCIDDCSDYAIKYKNCC